MQDRRDRGFDRGGSRDDRFRNDRRDGRGRDGDRDRRDERCGPDDRSRRDGGDRRDSGQMDRRGGGRDERRGGERGPGPDTRFLHLEASQLLYAEAQNVTKQAFREVLLEAAKARVRERFGDKLIGVAELAVDELLNDINTSLEVESRIQEHNEDRSRTKDRLRAIFRECDEDGEEDGDGCGGEDTKGDEES